MIKKLTKDKDIHGEYTTYLFNKGHSLHGLMRTVHNITIDVKNNKVVIRSRGCCTVPTKLQKHISWYAEKNYNVSTIELF